MDPFLERKRHYERTGEPFLSSTEYMRQLGWQTYERKVPPARRAETYNRALSFYEKQKQAMHALAEENERLRQENARYVELTRKSSRMLRHMRTNSKATEDKTPDVSAHDGSDDGGSADVVHTEPAAVADEGGGGSAGEAHATDVPDSGGQAAEHTG